MATPIKFSDLIGMCTRGSVGTLTKTDTFAPAGGSPIAATKFKDGNAFGIRVVDGKAVMTTVVDTKGSQSNRTEEALTRAIREGDGPLSRTPHVEVTYSDTNGSQTFFDTELPHRVFEGHIMFSSDAGKPTVKSDWYVDIRNSTTSGDLSPLASVSPVTAIFGGWDSARARNQLRIPSVISGEVYGILADQPSDLTSDPKVYNQGAARLDPVAAGFAGLPTKDIESRAALRREATAKVKTKTDEDKAASIGIGNIPPTLSTVSEVAVVEARRITLVSFTLLRSFRFGNDPAQNLAWRVLLGALSLAVITHRDAETYTPRANAHLDLVDSGTWEGRTATGEKITFPALTTDEADALLDEAIAYAESANIPNFMWERQFKELAGDPVIYASRVEADGSDA